MARRHIRKMRGGAQSHLVEADDGHHYIVKFQNNPQHRRILVNELVSSVILHYLQISTPETAVIHVTEDFLRENPEVYISLGSQKIQVSAGWHFGSRYPGDPARTVIYDFIPDALLSQVNNLADFLGICVFDKWIANADGRQCVFYRALVQDWSAAGPAARAKPGFVASMIDHGFVFNGPNWNFTDSPVQGLYGRKLVYEQVKSLDHFQPWLEQVAHFPEHVLDQACKQVPSEWIQREEEQFEQTLEKLMLRRGRVAELITSSRQAKSNPFPNWR